MGNLVVMWFIWLICDGKLSCCDIYFVYMLWEIKMCYLFGWFVIGLLCYLFGWLIFWIDLGMCVC